ERPAHPVRATAARPVPFGVRVLSILHDDPGADPPREAGPAPAGARADQPRRGVDPGGGGRTALSHPRPGHEWAGGAAGRPLLAQRSDRAESPARAGHGPRLTRALARPAREWRRCELVPAGPTPLPESRATRPGEDHLADHPDQRRPDYRPEPGPRPG